MSSADSLARTGKPCALRANAIKIAPARYQGPARIAVGLVMACMTTLATAQNYPTKVVRIVVPFPAGGVTDIIARGIASELSQIWRQTVIVENKPGANAIIASASVAKAAPDGYTILMVNASSLSSNQYLFTTLPYDPVRDFTPVVNIVASILVLVGTPSLKANTLQEFIAEAKARPGDMTYGSFGLGSAPHLSTEEFSATAGVKLNHIPYKGIADVIPAVMGGQIDVALSSVSPVLNLIRTGKLKAFAYGNPTRSRVLPDTPTFDELGVPLETRTWFGFAVPAGTPKAVVDKIAADTRRIIKTPAFDEKYVTGVGMELLDQGPEEFAEFLKKDRAKWQERVQRVNVKLN